MTTRITLLCQPATAALRAGNFPADEPLDLKQVEKIATLAHAFGQPDQVLCSPALCAQQTARELGQLPTIEPALREVDYGRWAGLSLKEIATAEPTELASWLSDPGLASHGGESLTSAIERIGQWLEHYRWAPGHTLIITHASVIKAVILHVLQAPSQAYWQLDISPLTQTILSVHQDQWRLKSSGAPVGLS
ncbi:histidine phosphatase family protein [Crenobacter sp. SG2305]|uniref:histidine phosphatase family protein n=1 Tax=Crenobacter oryzisoli TaxID=3056844 RepID=UPI0025AA7704|nr:histidine phosphatase family protein [Crenobacter sp. SG2305]MDN0084663.1 histidine phosphatase family protein [Crenobacter sp. SG2305]